MQFYYVSNLLVPDCRITIIALFLVMLVKVMYYVRKVDSYLTFMAFNAITIIRKMFWQFQDAFRCRKGQSSQA